MARARKILFFLLKLSVSGGILFLLISKVGGEKIVRNVSLSDPLAFAGAVGVYLLSSCLSALRWRLLIPVPPPPGRLFDMYMIGSFFNIYLPGLIGGDGIKAYYLSRDIKHGMTEKGDIGVAENFSETRSAFSRMLAVQNITAIASVFMDRYIGLSALLMIGIVSIPLGFRHLLEASERVPAIWLIPVIFIALFCATLVMFKLRACGRFAPIAKIYECLSFYEGKKETLFRAFVFSVIIQMLTIFAVFLLSRGLSINVSFTSLMFFIPLIVLISFLPVSISGLGLREGAFVIFLGTIGISPDRAVTLSLLWFFSVVSASLWGLIAYVRYRALSPESAARLKK